MAGITLIDYSDYAYGKTYWASIHGSTGAFRSFAYKDVPKFSLGRSSSYDAKGAFGVRAMVDSDDNTAGLESLSITIGAFLESVTPKMTDEPIQLHCAVTTRDNRYTSREQILNDAVAVKTQAHYVSEGKTSTYVYDPRKYTKFTFTFDEFANLGYYFGGYLYFWFWIDTRNNNITEDNRYVSFSFSGIIEQPVTNEGQPSGASFTNHGNLYSYIPNDYGITACSFASPMIVFLNDTISAGEEIEFNIVPRNGEAITCVYKDGENILASEVCNTDYVSYVCPVAWLADGNGGLAAAKTITVHLSDNTGRHSSRSFTLQATPIEIISEQTEIYDGDNFVFQISGRNEETLSVILNAGNTTFYNTSISSDNVSVTCGPGLFNTLGEYTRDTISIDVIITDRFGRAATYTFNLLSYPEITLQPKGTVTGEGTLVRFTVNARRATAYRWQVSENGVTWSDVVGETGNALEFAVSLTHDNNLYRCLVINNNGTVASEPVLLKVIHGMTIISQPVDVSVLEGRIATFEVSVIVDDRYGEVSYQVQERDNENAEWADLLDDNATSNSYSITALLTDDKKQFRFKLSNDEGTIYTDTAVLSVYEDPVILTHPQNVTIATNGYAAFGIGINAENADFLWQAKRSDTDEWMDVGDLFHAVNGRQQLKFVARKIYDGCQIRCVVSNILIEYISDAAVLTVTNEVDNSGIPIDEYTFPDNRFRYIVSQSYDLDKNGYLSDAEIESVTDLNIPSWMYPGIGSFAGIHYLSNLRMIDISGAEVDMIDFGDLPMLRELSVSSCVDLTSIKIGGCIGLETLNCGGNNLETLDTSGNMNLVSLSCENNALVSLSLENNAKLKKLVCSGNSLEELDLYLLPALQYLDCHHNDIQEFNIGSCDALVALVSTHNPIVSGDVAAYGNITDESYLRYDVTTNVKNDMSIQIITQPEGAVLLNAENVTFEILARGPHIQYEWQSNINNTGWNTTEAGSAAALTFQASIELDEAQFRVRVYNDFFSAYSDVVELRVYNVPHITTQPQDCITSNAREATFTITSDGKDEQYRWQIYTANNNEWREAATVTDLYLSSETLKFIAANAMNGYKVRCIVSNPVAQTTSDEVTLIVLRDPFITTQPFTAEVAFGAKHSFSLVVDGDDLQYQWMERKTSNDSWVNSTREGATTTSLIVLADNSTDQMQFRCVVSNRFHTTLSNTVSLVLITTPVIQADPQNISVVEGNSAAFSVNVSGRSMTFRWQVRQDESHDWTTFGGSDASSYKIAFSTSMHMNGYQYRCVISNIAGAVTSEPATLTVYMTMFSLADGSDGDYPNLLPAGEYIFSLNASGNGISYSLGFGVSGDTNWVCEDVTEPIHFYSDGRRPLRIILIAKSGVSAGTTIRPMLESGRTAHDWVSPVESQHDVVNDFNYDWFSIGNTYDNVENIVHASLPCEVTVRYRPIWKDTI